SGLRGGVAGRRYGGPRVSIEGTCFTFRPAQRGGAPGRGWWDGDRSAGGGRAAGPAALRRSAQPLDPPGARGPGRIGNRAQQSHGGATACAVSAGGGKAY